MAHVLVRQKVEDFAQWKRAFDVDAIVREDGGSQGGYVFQRTDDPHEVFILLAWDTMDHLRQFIQSSELKERMHRAGVVGSPDVYLLSLVDSPSI